MRSVSYEALKLVLRGYMAFFSRGVDVSGATQLPEGGKIIAANHSHASDPIHLPFVTREHLHCLAQSGLFEIPVLGFLFNKSGQIKVDRSNGASAFEEACQRLRRGETVAVFPEGTLCSRENPAKPKNGALRLALATGAPLVPLGFYVNPEHLAQWKIFWNKQRTGMWQVKGKCFARFGEPLVANAQLSVESQTADLMKRIYSLVDQLEMEKALAPARVGFPATADRSASSS